MTKPAPERTDEGGFLSRWSQRKAVSRTGAVAAEPALPEATPAPDPATAQVAPAARADGDAAPASRSAPTPERPPAPTLDDVAALGRDADFTRFVARDVDGPVRNAALKKLFSDPHYNVMDGLDIYIDDYGKPDPLPASMLRKMVQSKVLGLFSDEETEPPPEPATAGPAPTEIPAPDEDPDLRLQPDDAAGLEGAEPGPDEDGGRER